MAHRILLIGGGSGGHAYPLVAVAQALQARARQAGTNVELLMLGEGGLAERAAREGGIPFKRIMAGKFRRYASPLVVFDLIKLPIGALQSLWHLYWFMPDAIFSKGGYDSVLPALVGRLYFIPLYIHESDAVPGLANRILAPLARGIFIGFKSAGAFFKKRPAIWVGNPVRKELLAGDRSQALEYFKFKPNRPTVLIMGGSQGAKQINDIVLESLVLLTQRYQIIHQCGESQYRAVQGTIGQDEKEGATTYGPAILAEYRLYPFLDTRQLALAYALCDAVVSRAGAASIAEIAALGKPAVIVPLSSSAGGHQLANAQEFAGQGAVIVEGANMTSHILLSQLERLLDPATAADTGVRIKRFSTPEAADIIATALLG